MPTDVYYTTNPSDYAKLPGLYITERNPPGQIRGEDLGTVGFVDLCVRGPARAITITSNGRFTEIFGGRARPGAPGTLLGEVWKALLNKKFGTIVVRRVIPADAVLATRNLSNAVPTAIVRVDATSKGAWGNDVQVAVVAATNADATMFDLVVTYGGETRRYINLNTATGFDNLAETIGDDDANWIVVTKLANGRPIDSAAAALASGANGTVVAADYQTPLAEMRDEPGVDVVLIPSKFPTPGTVNGYITTAASLVADRMFYTWSADETNAVADEVTDVGAQITTRSDRIVWAANATYTVDPETGTEVLQGPHVWLASLASQLDVDVHLGAAEAGPLLAGIKRLYISALSRADLISLQAAGVSTLERLPGEFRFRQAVTTNLTSGLTEIARRRMADYLLLSAAARLRYYVKAKNNPTVRAAMIAELTAFSAELKEQERIIEQFSIESETVNTTAGRNEGTEKLLWRVKMIGHILALVLETEMGQTVEIREAA